MFLLREDGLNFFLATGNPEEAALLESKEGDCLVSNEKQKEDPMERENEKDVSLVISGWQNSMHWVTKIESFAIMGPAIVAYF